MIQPYKRDIKQRKREQPGHRGLKTMLLSLSFADSDHFKNYVAGDDLSASHTVKLSHLALHNALIKPASYVHA